jgi:membrane protease YdiL (CAAX protease family)
MSGFDRQTQPSDFAMIRFWQRIPLVIRAIVSGISVSTIGVYAWLAIGTLIPGLWAIVVMGGVLWLYWKYFSGSWWPQSTAEARRNGFRAAKMPAAVWKWSLVAAMLIVVVWQSGMVLTFRIVKFPAEAFTAGYNLEAIPLWLAWLMIIMSSLVAGICEETGYRGYMQVPLEERYSPGVAITIVSIMFLVIHLQQVWAPPVLFHLFALSVLLGILAYASGSLIPGIIAHTSLDIFNFSYRWTDVAGTFDKRPLAETGIDAHFVVWVLIFAASAVLFSWAARKTLAARQQM